MNNNTNILWADDEIDILKPQILFLESKNYKVTPVTNGFDALEKVKTEHFDVIFLDEQMPGMSGLETLGAIKEIRPHVPIVLITKSEEENLMDEAIGSKISDYLIKPVHPRQVFLSCKKNISSNQIKEDKIIKAFIDNYKIIKERITLVKTIEDWFDAINEIIEWEIKIDQTNNNSVVYFLEDLKNTINKGFSDFIEENYTDLIKTNYFPNKIIEKYINPLLDSNNKVALIVLDCLRYDQAKVILERLYSDFEIKINPALSFLPSSTQYSRNAIFSGLFPDEIESNFPEEWKLMNADSTNLNKYEECFFNEYLKKNLNHKISIHYEKIIEFDHGIKLFNKIKEYKNIDVIALVVNFIDILGHAFSNSKVVKEIIPNDAHYRKEVKSWFENSWLYETLLQFKKENRKIIITSDHGTTIVKKPIIIKADRNTSSGLRYKKGKNLYVNNKDGLLIKDPSKCRLPKEYENETYIIAKKDRFFVYPNDYNHYKNLYLNSFQHGGLSIEEIFIPVIELN